MPASERVRASWRSRRSTRTAVSIGPTLDPTAADQVWSRPRAVRLGLARLAGERARARRRSGGRRLWVGGPMRSTLGLAALFLLVACSAGPSARPEPTAVGAA